MVLLLLARLHLVLSFAWSFKKWCKVANLLFSFALLSEETIIVTKLLRDCSYYSESKLLLGLFCNSHAAIIIMFDSAAIKFFS